MEDDGNAKNDDDDDPSVHLERFQQSHKKRVRKMEEEKDKLQNEIETMNSIVGSAAASNDDDIIEINAGGKIISALRSTLTVAPDTMFTYMFSGRWEESMKRDNNNRVFLDEDSELIEMIINFLRMKKREDPLRPINEPILPVSKKENFDSILNYYGLTEFFYPPPVFLPLDIGKIDIVQQQLPGSLVTVTKSDNKIKFNKVTMDNSFHSVACKPSLNASSDEGSFWKVTIDKMPQWILLGIIGSLGGTNTSHTNPTCYGWSIGSQVWMGGSSRSGDSGWTTFTQGECLHFHLNSKKLTMFSVQKNKKFVINIATIPLREYYIHFNLYSIGTTISLEPLGEEERERILEN